MVDHILFQINNELFFTFWMNIISMKSNKFENRTKNGGGKGLSALPGILHACGPIWLQEGVKNNGLLMPFT